MSDEDDFLTKMAELNTMMERSSLLPDRCYLILNEIDDENVSMSIYDTTDFDPESNTVSAAQVMAYGILEIMESDLEQVLEAGMARISSLDIASEMPKIEGSGLGDNIIKVDFGKKH